MYRPPKSHAQTSLFCSLEEQLNHKHSLYVLANKIDWNKFETEFSKRFDDKMGAPNKPIRLMTGLIILKHIRNVSDESVVEQFQENAYYQYFCGERFFSTEQPCDPSALVHFRHQIGEEGLDMIPRKVSVSMPTTINKDRQDAARSFLTRPCRKRTSRSLQTPNLRTR